MSMIHSLKRQMPWIFEMNDNPRICMFLNIYASLKII